MNVFSNPIAQFNKTEPIEIDNKQNQVEYGDVFFTTSSETPDEVGMSSVWLENKGNIYLNSFCFGFRPFVKNDPYYMAYMLRSKNFRKNMTLLAQGISRYNISKNGVMNIDIQLPINQEQEKIGKLFYEIDNLITLHQRKYKFKKYSWEQRKLGQIAEIVGGGTPSTAIKEFWNGDINWYAPAEIGDQIYLKNSCRKISKLGLENSSARILPIGTVLFTSRAGIGNVGILKEKGATNQGFQSIVPKKDILDSYFIYSRSKELKNYGETVGAGSTFVEVSGKQMADMDILVPNIKEQEKIGHLFEDIDNLITLHQLMEIRRS